ncbi:MAG: gliding motility-associated C-terminal domain-containing protein [Saprospiraceae bacterium]|nr:gliding motility-associated C-terminal domain-containing protein [Saprospiraceae bacterium]
MRITLFYRSIFLAILLPLAQSSIAQCDQNYDWAVWTGFTGMEATGTISTPNGPISVSMTTNYTFDSTPGIYNYGIFSAFNDPPPNSTVPRTTWASGPGGETTMCFSETVSNPVLLLSSVGNPGLPVTLQFSLPYQVVFDGGGMTWVNSTTLIGQEGYGIIVFPGDFDCVTIYSSTPENYTNITWGINPPLFDVEIDGDTIACVNTTLTASGGQTYEWDGGQNPNSPSNTFTQSGQYFLTVTDGAGCTVVTSVNVTIHPEEEESLEAAICEGESYFFDGQLLEQPGYYEAYLQTFHGCDSIVGLLLDVWPVDYEDLTVTICEGEFYPFDNDILDQSGFYIAHLQNIHGCDSTVTLELIVLPTSIEAIDMTICEGEVLDFHGQFLTNPGIYSADLQNDFGCDSTVLLDLQVSSITTDSMQVDLCEGNAYIFQGDTLKQPGIYQADLQSNQGCDSTVILMLNFLQATASNASAAICQGETYFFEGDTLATPGIYTSMLTNQAGCDSTVTLDLEVYATPLTSLQAQICAGQSYPFQGMNLNSPGTYTANLQTMNGCDSTIQLTLEVVAVIAENADAAICEGESFSFNGLLLTAAGVYADTMLSSGGCDSIITLTLDVLPNPSQDLQAQICEGESYDFQGDLLTVAGDYSEVLTSWTGCDSTVHLQLTVHPTVFNPVQAQICTGQSYAFNGQTLTNPGSYIANLQTSQGCDSTVELTLSVATILTTDLDRSICAGDVFDFGGKPLFLSGTYTDMLTSSGGCDSLVTLSLTVYPSQSEETFVSTCEGEPLVFEGDTLTQSGQYSALFQTVNGCDSTHILNLTVHPAYDQIDIVQACDVYTWPENGQIYTQSTTFTSNGQTIHGCDSTRQLILTIHSSWKDVDSVTTNDPKYIWPVDKTIYTQSGTYFSNSTTASGCDSVHILHLTLLRTGIYIPTAFSPNDDGINDRFTIYGGADLALIESMTIYDRWGNKLATYADLPPGNPEFGWDGKSRGIFLDPGVYVFTGSLLMSDESHRFVKGEVTVVK